MKTVLSFFAKRYGDDIEKAFAEACALMIIVVLVASTTALAMASYVR